MDVPGKGEGGGPQQLQEKVLDPGLCVSCGFCTALCPYIKCNGDRVRVVYPCGRSEGNCAAGCPRAELDPPALDRFVFGRERADHELGEYQGIYYARARGTARAPRAQYGGTATALLGLALSLDLADGAVAVQQGDDGWPQPGLFLEPEAVKGGAGSRYVAVPSLVALAEARRKELGRVAVVGRPCQVEAIRRWQVIAGQNGEGSWVPAVSLTVGLFCFWALSAEFMFYLRQRVGQEIYRIDVPPQGMVVQSRAGEVLLPLSEVRPYIKPGCRVCFDPTAEWADLAVGSTEAEPEWNTLIVRTDRGRELVERGQALGMLELRPYPPERLPLLRQAARQKKQRVLAWLAEAAGPYIRLNSEYIEAVREG